MVAAPFVALGGRTLIRFLNDQQGVVFWYLDLAGPVLATNRYVDTDTNPAETNVYLVADSFEEFLYRYWLENLLWRRPSSNIPLSSPQAAYAKFYGYAEPE